MFRFLVFFSVLALTFGTSVRFKDCGSSSKVTVVTADPCNSQPCQLAKGQNYTIGIHFTSGEAATKLTNIIHGIIGGIPVPFPYDHKNACDGCGLNCPISDGTDYVFHATLPVEAAYPSIELIAKWEIQDENNNDLVCIEIEVAIVDGKTQNPKFKVVSNLH